MPSLIAGIACGAGALVMWGGLGFALGHRVLPATLSVPFAPVLGWACHSALALPFFLYAGLTFRTAAVAFLVPLVAAQKAR